MAELLVAGMTVLTDDRDRLHFWGEVFNQEEPTLRWVQVTVRLRNGEGEVLAEESDIAGLEWTLPGERNPFYIRFLTPPTGWQSYDVSVRGIPHDYADHSVPQPHTGVQVSKIHYRDIDRADLRCSLVGLLSNQGPEPATHVKVAGTLYGPGGRVVGVLSPYLVPRGSLAPGASMPFELKYYALGGQVADYRVRVQGRASA